MDGRMDEWKEYIQPASHSTFHPSITFSIAITYDYNNVKKREIGGDILC